MAHPWGWHISCPLWVKNLINVFRHYRIFTTIWTHRGHPMYRPYGRDRGQPLWVQILTDVLPHYMVLTTDTPWLVCKNDIWGVPCEFKVGLMYCITTGSSQQTSRGSSVRAIHGVTPVNSNYGWYITSLQGLHNRYHMASPQATGLDARASRVKWPAQFMSHWYGILFTE